MKQTIAIIAAFLLLLCAVGCSQNETAPSLTAEESQYHAIDQYLVTVDGQQYLILPVSQEHIQLSNTLLPYLAQIDLALLTAAEEKITAQATSHSQQAQFWIQLEEEQLYLYGEFIVFYPDATEAGCGLDHEHFCLCEPISNK